MVHTVLQWSGTMYNALKHKRRTKQSDEDSNRKVAILRENDQVVNQTLEKYKLQLSILLNFMNPQSIL